MALEDSALLAVEVEGVVLKERASLGKTLGHVPNGAVEGCRLPVAFGAEAIAFLHQTLRSEARNLVEAYETFAVGIVPAAEVVEVGGEALGTLGLEDGTEGKLSLGCVPDLLLANLLACLAGNDGIFLVVLLDEGIDVGVLDLLPVAHEFADGAVVNMITKNLLSSYLVAISNGYVVHLIAETDDKHILGISHSSGNACPNGDVLLYFRILPIAGNDLARLAETGADVAELTVTMCRLIEVHEVHVHGIPRNLLVVLGVEVQHRLVELLQAMNPHLGRREGVHPGDEAYALLIVVGSLHDGGYLLVGIGSAFIYNLDRDDT